MTYPYPDPPDLPWLAWFGGAMFLVALGMAIIRIRALRRGDFRLFDAWFWLALPFVLFVSIVGGAQSENPIPVESVADRILMSAFLIAFLITLLSLVVSAGVLFAGVRRRVWSTWPLWGFGVGCVILLYSLTPKVGGVREVARTSQCRNNLKRIALSMHNALENEGAFPAAIVRSEETGPPRSWRVELLPYLDERTLRPKYIDTKEWTDVANLPVAQQGPRSYSCPSNPHREDAGQRTLTAYVLPTGPGQAFDDAARRKVSDFQDGLSQTLLVVEACGLDIVWTEPRDVPVDSAPVGINLPGTARGTSPGLLSSHHPRGQRGGAYATFGDGVVRFLSGNTDPQVLRAMTTIRGGESVSDEF